MIAFSSTAKLPLLLQLPPSLRATYPVTLGRRCDLFCPDHRTPAMASVIWMSVFLFLCVELVITALLVMPLPRAVRKFMARKMRLLNLGVRVRSAAQCTSPSLLDARQRAPVSPRSSSTIFYPATSKSAPLASCFPAKYSLIQQ
jgi:Bap31/Bap29 transmembrane region